MPNKFNNDMTEDDIRFLKDNYEKLSVIQIANKLKKSKATIYKHIYKLGLHFENKIGKPWTNEEIEFLKNNYKKFTYKELAQMLNKTEKDVNGKIHGLGLSKSNNSKNWTENEINYLKEAVLTKSYDEIQEHLGRSKSVIHNKVYELQLIPNELKRNKKIKKEQADFILANYEKMTDAELAIKLNVSVSSIAAIRKKYNKYKTGNEVTGPTSIEKFVINFLNSKNIDYDYNKPLGDYVPDFSIKNTNILIEVQGDYFHCNPLVYGDEPKDVIQVKHVLRDYYKKCYYLSRGYAVYEIWEKDINENSQKVISFLENLLPSMDKVE